MGGGGAERQLTYLADPLITRGWRVHVALVAGGPNLRRLQQTGATIHQLRAASSYDPRLAWHVRRLIRQLRPDIVQPWFVQMEVVAGTAARLARIPWVLNERSSQLAYPPTWKNRLRIRIGRTADAIISNSAGGDDYWREKAAPHVPRFVIPNAVPVADIAEASPALPAGIMAGPDVRIVLVVGRIDREKNIERIFDACRRIAQRPATLVVLCGDGPMRPTILARITGEGLTARVIAPGYVETIWSAMKRADVIVSANTFEGRPNAVLEAMATGRPLVVSDIPVHREILDDDSAFWADPFDPASIAGAVDRALGDPAGAAFRATAAQARARTWSVEAVAADYDRVYRTLLSGAGSLRTPR
jgi:glycosyltransferase involved in cell wall biosynthesis